MEEAKKKLCHNRAVFFFFFKVAVSEMGAWALKNCTHFECGQCI